MYRNHTSTEQVACNKKYGQESRAIAMKPCDAARFRYA